MRSMHSRFSSKSAGKKSPWPKSRLCGKNEKKPRDSDTPERGSNQLINLKVPNIYQFEYICRRKKAKMENKQEKTAFERLREALPHGFSTIVVERLAAKGIKTTARNVQQVAKGLYRNSNIEEELLDLVANPPVKEKPKSDFEIKVEEALAKKGL